MLLLPQIIIFFIILSIVVLIHELGHFLTAKWFGIRVDEFGWGYPPRLFGKKIGETIYSINSLPFGGFVRLFGEQEEEVASQDKKNQKKVDRAFFSKGKKARAFVIVAGVMMNFLLGVVAFSLVYSLVGIPQNVDYVTIAAVVPGSPAQKAGLTEDSRVLTINDSPVSTVNEFKNIMDKNKGREVSVVLAPRINKIWNLEKSWSVTIVPRENPPEGEGALGVLISNVDNIFYPVWQMPFRGAWVGIKEAVGWGLTMLVGVFTVFKQLLVEGVAPQVAGPVGIYKITSMVSTQGFLALVKFTGILSINLAVINILPIPALDGGRLVFIFLEKARGRKIKPVIEYWVNLAGMLLLVSLMLIVTAKEIFQLESVKNILDKFK